MIYFFFSALSWFVMSIVAFLFLLSLFCGCVYGSHGSVSLWSLEKFVSSKKCQSTSRNNLNVFGLMIFMVTFKLDSCNAQLVNFRIPCFSWLASTGHPQEYQHLEQIQ